MSYKQQRIKSVSLRIRKLQRGLHFVVTERKIKEIEQLKDELEELTGSRTPTTPKWPI